MVRMKHSVLVPYEVFNFYFFFQFEAGYHSKIGRPLFAMGNEDEPVPAYVTPLRIICGSSAGALTKTIIAPLERIKILHQTQVSS